MTSTTFPEANSHQRGRASNFFEVVGSDDGAGIVITAWKPGPEALERLNKGGLIYITFFIYPDWRHVPGHFLSTDFDTASPPE